jgi:hypothetical protein
MNNNPICLNDPFGDKPPSAKRTQKIVRKLVSNAQFGYAKYTEGNLVIGRSPSNELFGFTYTGNSFTPSQVIDKVFTLVSAGDVQMDCQFFITLMQTKLVLEDIGEKNFNKLFENEPQKDEKGNEIKTNKYNMAVVGTNLLKGLENTGYSSTIIDMSSKTPEESKKAIDDAPIGTAFYLESQNKEITLINHQGENVLKVGQNKYAVFDYTKGKDPTFFTYDELIKTISAGASTDKSKKVEFKIKSITIPKLTKE